MTDAGGASPSGARTLVALVALAVTACAATPPVRPGLPMAASAPLAGTVGTTFAAGYAALAVPFGLALDGDGWQAALEAGFSTVPASPLLPAAAAFVWLPISGHVGAAVRWPG